MNRYQPTDAFDPDDGATQDHDRDECPDFQERGLCGVCGVNVEGYGLTPPEAPPARPIYYRREADEWNETLTESQEYGAIMVGHILWNDPKQYAKTVAAAGFDTHAEVAAISDYIALAHPTYPQIGWEYGPAPLLDRDGPPLPIEQQPLADVRHFPAMEWLTWWVRAGNVPQWGLSASDEQHRASRCLREIVARDGIHVVLLNVQYAVEELCDTFTLQEWVERMAMPDTQDIG